MIPLRAAVLLNHSGLLFWLLWLLW